jgi:hypothetical protein
VDCQSLRDRLLLHVDEELPPAEMELLQEHAQRCFPCTEMADEERACWERVRSVLLQDQAPAGLMARLDSCLEEEERRVSRRHVFQARILPLAAAVLLGVGLWFGLGSNGATGSGGVQQAGALGHGKHGPITGSFRSKLGAIEKDRGRQILSRELLLRHGVEVASIEEARPILEELFGGRPELVATLLEEKPSCGRTELAGLRDDPLVILVPHREQLIGIARLPADEGLVVGLHAASDQTATDAVSVEHCPRCNVVAIKREPYIYLLMAPRSGEGLPELTEAALSAR